MSTLNSFTMRIIANLHDEETCVLAEGIQQTFRPFYDDVSSVSLCTVEECAKCRVQRRCRIVVALFTEKPAELTASMVSVCAQGLALCTGVLIILEPSSHPRQLLLPNMRNVIRKRYHPGDSLSLITAEALHEYARTCEGGALNLQPPPEFTRPYEVFLRDHQHQAA